MHIFAKNANVNVMRRRFCADGVMHIYQRTISGFNLFYSLEDFLVFYTIVSVQARRRHICLLGLGQTILNSSVVLCLLVRLYMSGNSMQGQEGPDLCLNLDTEVL